MQIKMKKLESRVQVMTVHSNAKNEGPRAEGDIVREDNNVGRGEYPERGAAMEEVHKVDAGVNPRTIRCTKRKEQQWNARI